jgi:ABC-2 type transport system permease protein
VNANLALTQHALREAFTGRRRIGLALLALAPAALAFALDRWGGGHADAETAFVVFVVGVGLVVPLMALWIGIATLREELVNGTIVHLATRPISRAQILLTRLVGAALATWLLAGVGLTLVFPAAGHFDGGMLGTTWLVTGLAALAYTSLFALMGALTDRGVLAGLVYVVGWESIVASTDLPFRYATVAYWVRSIVDQQGHVSGGLLAGEIADPATLSTSILVLVGIAAGAALVGTLWFQRRELAGAEPE